MPEFYDPWTLAIDRVDIMKGRNTFGFGIDKKIAELMVENIRSNKNVSYQYHSAERIHDRIIYLR